MALSDRVAVLSAGRIRQIGPPAEVYERPADRFVAGFVGQASFLACGALERAGDIWTLRHLATGALVRCASGRDCRPGERLSLMIRPERLSFAEGGATPDGANALNGKLLDVTFRGDHAMCAVELPGGEGLAVSLDGRAAGMIARRAAQQAVTVWFMPEDGVLLAEEEP